MATVGTPVTLSALVQDRGRRYGLAEREVYPVRAEFILHQGPAAIDVDPPFVRAESESAELEGGVSTIGEWSTVSTRATFSEPGDYVVRVRVDNFGAPDSKFDNMCCWANAYIPVTVR
jgi:hypothetical protein